MIGMTQAEAIKQLGQPTSKDSSHFYWHIDSLAIDYDFEPRRGAVVEKFTMTTPSAKLTLEDARKLIGEDMDISKWTEASFIGVDCYAWRSNLDRRAAVFHPKSGILIITSEVDWIEGITHATGLEWEDRMGPRARER